MTRTTLALALGALILAAPASPQHHNMHDARALAEDPRQATEQLAPVLEGLGENHLAVTTASERAQLFFDQGLKLTYAFNHQEALRSFKEAARLDSDLAMAYWGWALVLGPNLNLPMRPEVVPQAYAAAQMAMERREKASDKERMLIEALALRYSEDPEADRASLDAAYADAMAAVYEKYPEDDDVATLYGAALMNLTPWDYWTGDGRPKSGTTRFLEVFEAVMHRDPHHEGALHYYIHAVEPVDAERGEWAADQLRGLAPGAGHLVHMPSHVYIQVGRYAEAFEANVLAAKADEGYITQCRAQGIYPLNYYPHNVHFLAWAAIMQGRSAAALEASRKVASKVPADHHGNDWALYQTFLSMPLYTMTRFGMWEEILAEPRPPEELRYWAGISHYARGLSRVHTDRPKEAREELDALARIATDPTTPEVLIGFSNAQVLLTIAHQVLEGEVAARAGDFGVAVAHLDKAVRYEDSLLYTEPPDWYYPVRHNLGAVLLEAGRLVEAEVVYKQDLAKYRDNGYSLYGLARTLEAMGRSTEARKLERRYRESWKDADVTLSSSRF